MGEFLKDEVIGKLKGRIETLARDSQDRKEFELALDEIKNQIETLQLELDNEIRSTRTQIGYLADQNQKIEFLVAKAQSGVNGVSNVLITLGVFTGLIGLVLVYFGK